MNSRMCPSCKNEFLQPFVCTTCGAQRLYDNTLRQLERRVRALEAALAKAAIGLHEAEEERYGWKEAVYEALRDPLVKAALEEPTL